MGHAPSWGSHKCVCSSCHSAAHRCDTKLLQPFCATSPVPHSPGCGTLSWNRGSTPPWKEGRLIGWGMTCYHCIQLFTNTAGGCLLSLSWSSSNSRESSGHLSLNQETAFWQLLLAPHNTVKSSLQRLRLGGRRQVDASGKALERELATAHNMGLGSKLLEGMRETAVPSECVVELMDLNRCDE